MTNSAYILDCRNVSKSFRVVKAQHSSIKRYVVSLLSRNNVAEAEKIKIINNVSLRMKEGSAIALLGKNGCGKSTLLRLLSGIYKPSEGTIFTQGNVVPLIEVGAGFNYLLTGRQNIFLYGSFLGMTNAEIKYKQNEIIQFSELQDFIDMPLKNYSTGMQMRLGFSVAMHANPDLLLADEILSVGDEDFQKKCRHKIADLLKEGMGLIFVTHSVELAKEFCDKYILLENGFITKSGETANLA